MRWECRLSTWRFMNRSTGELLPVDCKSWACSVHAPMLQWRWRKRVELVRWTLFWTFTLVPESRSEARRIWHNIRRWLRRRGMVTYLRSMEIGKGGMRHWHVLLAGAARVEFAEVQALAVRNGLGSILWVTKVEDQARMASYVTKYATKGDGSGNEERFQGWRRLTISRDVAPWHVVRERLGQHLPAGRDTSRGWKLLRPRDVPIIARPDGSLKWPK